VKKISRPISEGEAFGSSVHNALKKWGELEIELGKGNRESGKRSDQLALFDVDTKEPIPQSLIPNTLIELWHDSFIVDGFPTRMEADFARKNGEALMHHFYEWWSKEARAVSIIEKGFAVDIDGLEVKGRFDRIEQTDHGLRIIDFKTSAPRSQDEVDADLQLSLYAMAAEETLGQPCAELVLLFLSEEEVIERVTSRTQGQLTDARKQILSIRSRIDEKDFHPTPAKEKCKYCPYRNICDASAV